MNQIFSKIAKTLLIAGAFLLSFFGGKMIGKAKQQTKQAEANLKHNQKGQKIQGEVKNDENLQTAIEITNAINNS